MSHLSKIKTRLTDRTHLLQALRELPFVTASGAQLLLQDVAKVSIEEGPPMLRSENARLSGWVYVDVRGRDIRSVVNDMQAAVASAVPMPSGYALSWSGQFEYLERATERMKLVVPVTLAVIFVLIYFNMKNITETLITMLTLPFALIGGVWGMYWLGYNWSVAVAIGFIALAGLAAETGIIMHVYLDLAYKKHRREKGRPLTAKELYDAVIEGAVQRVRPKLMTVLTDFIALMPILWATTPGAGPMNSIAMSAPGSFPESRIILSARSTILTGSPMSST